MELDDASQAYLIKIAKYELREFITCEVIQRRATSS
jgi:hypothetical protein